MALFIVLLPGSCDPIRVSALPLTLPQQRGWVFLVFGVWLDLDLPDRPLPSLLCLYQPLDCMHSGSSLLSTFPANPIASPLSHFHSTQLNPTLPFCSFAAFLCSSFVQSAFCMFFVSLRLVCVLLCKEMGTGNAQFPTVLLSQLDFAPRV